MFFNSLYKSRGFTLMEALIAGFILFMVLATASMVYRGALISSMSATQASKPFALTPYIIEAVKFDLRENSSDSDTVNGEGHFLDMSYTWQAKLVSSKQPPGEISPETGELLTPDLHINLWQVDVVINKDNQSKKTWELSFKEVSW